MPFVSIVDEDSFAHVLGNRPSPVALLVDTEIVASHSNNIRRVDSMYCGMTKGRGDIGITRCIEAGESAIAGIVVMEVPKTLVKDIETEEIQLLRQAADVPYPFPLTRGAGQTVTTWLCN